MKTNDRTQYRYVPKGSTEIRHALGVAYTSETNGVPYALGYRGKAGKAEWNYRFKTVEQRDKHIADWFKSLEDSASYKAKRAEERRADRAKERASLMAADTEVSGDYSLTGTAEAIRQTLKQAFPGTRFSVVSNRYAGGCSIDVNWTDGPTSKQVKAIADAFQGADFDGMQDLKVYRGATEWRGRRVKFHVDYVSENRSHSEAVLKAVADVVSYQCGCACPAIVDGSLSGSDSRVPYQWLRDQEFEGLESLDNLRMAHDSMGGEWLFTLIWRVCSALSLEAARPADVPRLVNEQYINDTVKSLLS